MCRFYGGLQVILLELVFFFKTVRPVLTVGVYLHASQRRRAHTAYLRQGSFSSQHDLFMAAGAQLPTRAMPESFTGLSQVTNITSTYRICMEQPARSIHPLLGVRGAVAVMKGSLQKGCH